MTCQATEKIRGDYGVLFPVNTTNYIATPYVRQRPVRRPSKAVEPVGFTEFDRLGRRSYGQSGNIRGLCSRITGSRARKPMRHRNLLPAGPADKIRPGTPF